MTYNSNERFPRTLIAPHATDGEQPMPDQNQSPRRKSVQGPFGGPAIYLGRIFGIDIGLDFSWIVIFLLVTVSLAQGFGAENEAWSKALKWGAAIATSLLFFLSILLHELGHSVTSNGLGLPIRSITLFIFGGVARLSREPDRPRDEFLIAIAGPLVSLALGFGFIFLGRSIGAETGGAQVLSTIFGWLGRINITLVIFNCIPGFPLDGGRVLRSMIWGLTHNYQRATRIAAGGGVAFAYVLMIGGAALVFVFGLPVINGLWLALIGWFLRGAARSSVTQMVMKDSLEAVKVNEVYDDGYALVPGAMSVAQLIEGPILNQGRRTFFVEAGGQVTGLVTLQEVKKVPSEERLQTPIQSIAAPLDRLHSLSPDDTLWSALQKMDQAGVNQMPVIRDGHLEGVLTRQSVLRVVRNRIEFGET